MHDRFGMLGLERGRVRCGERLLAGLVDDVRRRRSVVEQVLVELLFRLREQYAVLRALGAGDRRHNRRQVELDVLAVFGLAGGVVPEALLLGVFLDELDCVLLATGQAQVLERDVVHGEDRGGRAELRRHVADRGTVGERHGADALTVELHELADDTVLAQHVRDRQDDVGRRHAGGDLAGELEADDARDEHRHRLAEHRRLRLDAADAPAEHTEAVDHRGVRVGADARVGVRTHHTVGRTVIDDLGEVLDVDLVHDAGPWRHDLEVVERRLAPAQELVALTVALVLDLHVALQRVLAPEQVGDDRVVDDHLSGRERVDLVRVSAECRHRLAHGGEVDDARNTREVLHHHSRRRELDLGARLRRRVPVAECADLLVGDVLAVLRAEQVLEEDFEAVRQLLVALHRVEAVDLVVGAADFQGALGTEAVHRGHRFISFGIDRGLCPSSCPSHGPRASKGRLTCWTSSELAPGRQFILTSR